MTVSYVKYGLPDGFLMNWLTAGPQTMSLQDLSKSEESTDKQIIFSQLLEVNPGIFNSAVERGPLHEGTFTLDGYQGAWNYYRCREDHLVDLSAAYPTSQFVRAWAFTQLYSQVEKPVQFTLTAFGPVDVWINKKSVFRTMHSSNQPISYGF